MAVSFAASSSCMRQASGMFTKNSKCFLVLLHGVQTGASCETSCHRTFCVPEVYTDEKSTLDTVMELKALQKIMFQQILICHSVLGRPELLEAK